MGPTGMKPFGFNFTTLVTVTHNTEDSLYRGVCIGGLFRRLKSLEQKRSYILFSSLL